MVLVRAQAWRLCSRVLPLILTNPQNLEQTDTNFSVPWGRNCWNTLLGTNIIADTM